MPVDQYFPDRYFVSEGFLPGYSFPWLPLAAFISPNARLTVMDSYFYGYSHGQVA